MNPAVNALLGLLFLGLGLGATFLMFHLWGYPFDKATRTSAAPPRLMALHRALGYAYVVVYVFLMVQMVPRMWEYQVELAPRTVIHLVLGVTIGFILMIKLAVLRWFRHLEEWMPYLGTALLLCTVLLMALSLPFTLRERMLAADTDAFSADNRARVAHLLEGADLPPEAPLRRLASERGLRRGRAVLLEKCVTCHDLRTVLARPRVPSDWVHTVARMAERPVLFTPITSEDEWHVSAYLIAITPELAHSLARKRAAPAATGVVTQDADARVAFERTCSQCHKASDVERSPPRTDAQIEALIARMVDNGLLAAAPELAQVRAYLRQTYVK
jgi:hypothetical protein